MITWNKMAVLAIVIILSLVTIGFDIARSIIPANAEQVARIRRLYKDGLIHDHEISVYGRGGITINEYHDLLNAAEGRALLRDFRRPE